MTAVVLECPLMCVDLLDNGYQPFQQMASAMAACTDQMKTSAAPALEKPVRLGVRYRIKAFGYRFFQQLRRDELR